MNLRPRLFALLVTLLAIAVPAEWAAGQDRNVNMVSGTQWPGGDPFLQRQNEPSIAASTRNPLHLLAGANDYRTVDLPGLENIKVIGDAWLGVFRSYDGGNTWTSTLLPGYPQDASPVGMASPLKGYPAGADPVVRAGANGIFYYAGITLTRDENPLGAFFVARYLDHNDKESSHLVREEAHPIRYVDATIVQKGTSGQFNDKPWIAVDVPRAGSAPCTVAGQTLDGGNVYAAWTVLVGGDVNVRSRMLVSHSTDCGATWSHPIYLSETHAINQGASVAIDPRNGNVYVVWRRIRNDKGETDALLFSKSTDFGKTFSMAQVIREITPFEQGTSIVSFRTTMFPSMTVDDNGRIYIVWSERNAEWRGRIAMISSTDGATWSEPVFVANDGTGHQFMPTINFANGKLTLGWYDQRADHTRGVYTAVRTAEKHTGQYTEVRQPMGHLALGRPEEVFRDFIVEFGATEALLRRHTLDVYVGQADPSLLTTTPAFQTHRASRYYFGSRPSPNPETGIFEIEQMQYNPPNLPLFRQGTTPFMGDYIDVAPAENMTKDENGWRFRTEPSKNPVRHLVWTDNRDVRPPADGNWRNYTPVGSTGGTSVFDGTVKPACTTGQTGMRNQNIYTTRVTNGLFAASPGNTKPFFDEFGQPLKRAFVVFVQNALKETRTYRLQLVYTSPQTIASFLQFAELPVLYVSVPPRSTIARTVFAVSALKYDSIDVNVEEVALDCVDPTACPPLIDGLSTTVILNPDIANPDIANPDIANPDIANPDIANAEVYNPDIANPDIANPDIANPDIANPDIANPDIANPDIANPDIANPDIANPDIANPDIANPDIANPDIANGTVTDTTWEMTNEGNTTASYSVNLLLNGHVPEAFKLQLILYRIYTTPIAKGCNLELERHTVLAANINNPEFTAPGDLATSDVTDPSEKNATVSILPGETIRITLRVVDPIAGDGITFDAANDVKPVVVAHAVNTAEAAAGVQTPSVALVVTTFRVPDAISGTPYSATLEAIGGRGTRTWSIVAGALPAEIVLDPATGDLSGTTSSPGRYGFTAAVADANGHDDEQIVRFDVVEPLAIVDTTVPDATLNTAYSHTFTTSGGVTPFTWSVVAGTLPPGLTLSESGVLQGTPTAVGSSTFTVRVTDGTFPAPQIDEADLTLNIIGGQIFTVTNTNDSGAGSLRQAILDANANVGLTDTIVFAIGGTTPHRITPLSPLPAIDDPVLLDATETGTCAAPVIVLDGTSAASAPGLVIHAGGTTIRGLSITRFAPHAGIFLGGGSESVIECNYLGLEPDGVPEGNLDGIRIVGSTDNTIRGNVVSGNVVDGIAIIGPEAGTTGSTVMQTLVEGNFIGSDPSGTLARPNGANGIHIVNSGGNTIGSIAGRNVISGNDGEGVRIDGATATGNVVQGNYIGTTVTGSAALANGASGVYVRRAPANAILDNVISGNAGFAGVAICGNANFCGGGNVGTQGSDASGNIVRGNRIGTDAAGTAAVPNQAAGLTLDGTPSNVIGGAGAGEGNVISGNGSHGMILLGAGADGNLIRGNFIGTDASGSLDLGNGGIGILLQTGSSNTIGGTSNGTAGNFIAFNVNGIALEPGAGSGNLLRFNRITSNDSLGIDLGTNGVTTNDAGDGDTGPNDLQNFSVITSVTSGGGVSTVEGTLNSTPNSEFVIDFFFNLSCDPDGFGEGNTWFGSVTQTTDGKGNLTFKSTIGVELSTGVVTSLATLTATSAGLAIHSTSEFSACKTVQQTVAGGALSFDGLDDIVTVAHASSLSLQTHTIEAWIKIDDPAFDRAPLLSKGPEFGNYTLAVGGDAGLNPRNVEYVHQTSTGNYSCCAVTPGPVPFGVWTHVAATFSGATARVYVNGKFVSSGLAENPPVENIAALTLGRAVFSGVPGQFLKGLLDEVRIWNVARSDADIDGSYNTAVAPGSEGLVGYWKFDETSGETVTDSSASANHGTLGADGTADSDEPIRVRSTAPIIP